MDTLREPIVQRPSVQPIEIVAYLVLAAGFVLMVLGIYEIGGLFNVGLGFALVWIGALATLVRLGHHRRASVFELRRG